jgi:hypothetical protein
MVTLRMKLSTSVNETNEIVIKFGFEFDEDRDNINNDK